MARIFGLDLVRAIAITLVVFSHIDLFSFLNNYNPYITLFLGFIGVQLFFVLSGFLIGTIHIKDYELNKEYNSKVIWKFWKRRWFRTLPNYYLMLLIYFLVFRYFDVEYLFFFQAMRHEIPEVFNVSWSLTIEEWSYILFPIILIGLSKLIKNKRLALLLACLLIILFSTSIRFAHLYPSYNNWDIIFRKSTLFQLDSIFYGVIGAIIAYYQPRLWSKSKYPTIIGLIILALCTKSFFDNMPVMSDFMKTLYFSVFNLGILLVLSGFSSWNKTQTKGYPRLVLWISLLSYSIYLNHTLIVYLVSLGGFSLVIKTILELFLILLISHFQYFYFEKPITGLRESHKIFK